MYVSKWPTLRGPVILTYLEDILMEECWTECWFSMTLSLTYKYICRSVTFILWYSYSALNFQYYLMNIWILVLIWVIDMYFMIKRFWIIYLFLPLVVCWSLVWKYLWMLQVRNRPVVYSRHEAGSSVYFGHISSYIKKWKWNSGLYVDTDAKKNIYICDKSACSFPEVPKFDFHCLNSTFWRITPCFGRILMYVIASANIILGYCLS